MFSCGNALVHGCGDEWILGPCEDATAEARSLVGHNQQREGQTLCTNRAGVVPFFLGLPGTSLRETTPMSEDDVLLTERQAADLLQLTPRFLQQRRYRGDSPPWIKISSRCIRYQRSAIKSWLAERVRTSTSDPGSSDYKGDTSNERVE